MIFWLFYVLNFFLYFFFFYRMCAERAQEHTRTHTPLTAGVEGEEPTRKLQYIFERARHRNGPIALQYGWKKSQQRGVDRSCTHDDEIM